MLPLVQRTSSALSRWLSPAWASRVRLVPDLDQIDALSPEREALWARLETSSFLTDDEKRAAVGYAAMGEVEEESGEPAVLKYNPYHDDQGRFTHGPGGPRSREGQRVAQLDGPQQYSVNLLEEEARGGHAIVNHVGKSDEELLAIVRAARLRTLLYTTSMKALGTFESIEAANDYTNQLLQLNRSTVDLVASGKQERAWLEQRVGSPTGREAFRPNADADPYIRPTYKIGTLIVHDRNAPRGYKVRTSYPLNDYPK